MAIYTVNEIATITKFKPQNINTYKLRGKIILVNGTFDDSNPINKHWLKQRLNNLGLSGQETQINTPKTKQSGDKPTNNAETKDNKEIAVYLKRMDKLKLLKLEQEVEFAKMKTQKIKGEVIPVEFVERIFGIHFNNITSEFFNASDNYTAVIVSELNGTREQLIKFRHNLKNIISQSVEEAKKISKRDISLAASKYMKDEEVSE